MRRILLFLTAVLLCSTLGAQQIAPRAFAIFVDNHLKAVTTDRSYNLGGIDGNVTVRAANAMGGFGIAYDPTGIELVEVSGDDVVNTTYYSIDGMRTSESARGIIIRVQTLKSGKTVTTKLVK